MGLPHELFLFGVAFFGFMAVVNAVQARRKKEKAYYLSAIVAFLMLLSLICILLNQFIFFLIPFVSAFILSIIWSSKTREAMWRETVKQLEETDVLAPLKVRDFLEWKAWIKLASIYGFRKTMCLYCLFMTAVGGAIFFALNIFGMIRTVWAAGFTILVGIGSAIMFYRQIGKAFKLKQAT